MAGPRALCWALLLGLARACPDACDCEERLGFGIADCAYRDLEAVPSGFPAHVTTLSLSANRLAALPEGAFRETPRLRALWLAHNRIGRVAPGALGPLAGLRSLDLSHNLLSDFAWGDLRRLPGLQLLQLDGNALGAVPRDALRGLRALRSLRLGHNRLRALEPGTFDGLAALSHVRLDGNPFHCGCGLAWLRAWVPPAAAALPEREGAVCASPPALRGAPLARLPPLPCAPPAVRLSLRPGPAGPALALHCAAHGLPAPRLRWRLQTPRGALDIPDVGGADGRAPPRVRAFANGSLLVPDFGDADQGTYRCRATNELGSAEAAVTVALAAPRGGRRGTPGGAGSKAGRPWITRCGRRGPRTAWSSSTSAGPGTPRPPWSERGVLGRGAPRACSSSPSPSPAPASSPPPPNSCPRGVPGALHSPTSPAPPNSSATPRAPACTPAQS